ncbi:MAG: reprolysin-like metallopeptidase [Planctomycetota bacterium]
MAMLSGIANASLMPIQPLLRVAGEVVDERVLSTSPDGSWSVIERVGIAAEASEEWIRPFEGRAARLDMDAMRVALLGAPMEFTQAAFDRPAMIDLPRPDGGYEVFEIVEAPVMAKELQAKYPQIRTYRGQSLDKKANHVRISVTPAGFRAQVMSPQGWYYIDRYSRDDSTLYSSYLRSGLEYSQKGFVCQAAAAAEDDLADAAEQAFAGFGSASKNAGVLQNGQLRTYRFASMATNEYTNFFGGTVADGLGGLVESLNRLVQVYEVDFAVRLELVADNDKLIFTNQNPDPFNFILLSQVDSQIDVLIGFGSYDVGHLVDVGAGGVAFLASVCTSSKGGGYTGFSPPTGDPFAIDYFSHEVGHQFNGQHTFNGDSFSCAGSQLSAATAFEPGSGTTIMAYAGICGDDNVQSNSDPYFHFNSIDRTRSNITFQSGSACPDITTTGNSNPTVEAGPARLIPTGTPFVLTAVGSDPDNDFLTYAWEQADLGPVQDLGAGDNGQSPLFRSRLLESPSRSFPRVQDAWIPGGTDAETLPTQRDGNNRMNFRVTVRDNRSGGGATASDTTTVETVPGAGPFRVTSQTNGPEYFPGQSVEVTWDVANTDVFPLLENSVSIDFAANGVDFNTVLVSSTPNDGSALVTIPDEFASAGRIRVKAINGIFYALSPSPISIDVPPVPASWSIVGGAPASLEPNVLTEIIFSFDPGSTSGITGAPALITSTTSSPFPVFDTLSEIDPNTFLGFLPAADCDETVFYRVQVQVGSDVIPFPASAGFEFESVQVICNNECPGDSNRDGVLSSDDFTAWLTLFLANDLGADENNDGVLTAADFSAWLSNFLAGCD